MKATRWLEQEDTRDIGRVGGAGRAWAVERRRTSKRFDAQIPTQTLCLLGARHRYDRERLLRRLASLDGRLASMTRLWWPF